MARTDVQMRQDVLDQLRWDDRVSSDDVEVVAHDGVVTLAGQVPTWTARQAAEEDAWDIAGVRQVANELDVRFKDGAPAADPEVRERVTGALGSSAELSGSDVRITVNEGVVTLDGVVEAYWRRRLAAQLAGQVDGVASIENNLVVERGTSRSDRHIESSLRRALERNAVVEGDDVEISVDDGVVTVSGIVGDWRAYQAVVNAAAYTAGVVDVVDELEIAQPALAR